MEKEKVNWWTKKRCQLSGTSCNIVAVRLKLSRQETCFPLGVDGPVVTSPNVGWVDYGSRTRSQASVLPRPWAWLINRQRDLVSVGLGTGLVRAFWFLRGLGMTIRRIPNGLRTLSERFPKISELFSYPDPQKPDRAACRSIRLEEIARKTRTERTVNL